MRPRPAPASASSTLPATLITPRPLDTAPRRSPVSPAAPAPSTGSRTVSKSYFPALSTPSFTSRTRIQLLSYPTTSGWGAVISNYGGNYQGWYVGITSTGRAVLAVATTPSSAPWLVSNTTLALGRWYCLTATYDGATRQGALYVNGAFDVQAVFPGFTPQSAVPLTFGRASWFDGYYLNAVLDEARLDSSRLTPSQVASDYQSFPAPPPPSSTCPPRRLAPGRHRQRPRRHPPATIAREPTPARPRPPESATTLASSTAPAMRPACLRVKPSARRPSPSAPGSNCCLIPQPPDGPCCPPTTAAITRAGISESTPAAG